MQIRTYYTLVEKDTATVNKLWKYSHIILLLSAAVSGFITCYSLGEVTHAFGEYCVLYAEIAFESPTTTHHPLLTPTTVTTTTTTVTETSVSNATNTSTGSPFYTFPQLESKSPAQFGKIDVANTQWGNHRMCNFCQFTPLMSMIFALCWLMFFIMCGSGGAGYQSDVLSKPWHIVYPALIFSTVFSITLSVSTVHMSHGLTEFCTNFKQNIASNYYRCIPEVDRFTTIFWEGKTKSAYVNTICCFIFAHFGLIAWWTQTVLLVLRIFCIADFDMQVLRETVKAEAPLNSTRVQEVQL